MIYCVTGSPGGGKGIYSASLLEHACLSGRFVATNIVLTDRCPYRDYCFVMDVYPQYPTFQGGDNGKDFIAFWHYLPRGAFILVDEADLYFYCREFRDMPRQIFQYAKQHRKLGHDVVLVVQDINNLEVTWRRFAQVFVTCEYNYRTSWVIQKMGRWCSRFLRSEFGSADMSPSSHIRDGFFTYGEASRFFGWYDTEQLLGDCSQYAGAMAS